MYNRPATAHANAMYPYRRYHADKDNEDQDVSHDTVDEVGAKLVHGVVVSRVRFAISSPQRNFFATVSAITCECRSLAPIKAIYIAGSRYEVAMFTAPTIRRIKAASS